MNVYRNQLQLSSSERPVKGFQEVVFSLYDIDGFARTMQDIGGYNICANGRLDRLELANWGLSPEANCREIVMHNPGDEIGLLRLLQFEGVQQKVIRSSGQIWDTGGIFDVNIRVKDMANAFKGFQRYGWHAHADPTYFEFGKFKVEEVLLKGPGEVVIALIQRHAPPLEGFPNMGAFSHIFNSTQIVSDMHTALSFYQKVLGFQIYMEHTGASPEPGANVLGLPYNLADKIQRHVFIVHPQKMNWGSIELLQFEELSGNNHSARAIPPNVGIMTLRFPVHDIHHFYESIVQKGAKVVTPIHRIKMAPYGTVNKFALVTPNGAWLEFIEAAYT